MPEPEDLEGYQHNDAEAAQPSIITMQEEKTKTGFAFYDELPPACLEWYEDHIDEPLRPLICYLRNCGINTIECCAHSMQIFYDSKRTDHRTLETLMMLFFHTNWKDEGTWWIENKVVPDCNSRRWDGIITLSLPRIHKAYLKNEIRLHKAELALYNESPPLDPESDELYRTSTSERIGHIKMRLREDKATLEQMED